MVCPRYAGESGPYQSVQEAIQAHPYSSSSTVQLDPGYALRFKPYTTCGRGFPSYGWGEVVSEMMIVRWQQVANPDQKIYTYVRRSRRITCPSGSVADNHRWCFKPTLDPINNGDQCEMTGNPIHILSGNKYQKEIDYQPAHSSSLLKLVRYYNSRAEIYGSFGNKWTSNLDVSIGYGYSGGTIHVHLPDGKVLTYIDEAGRWLPKPHSNYRLEQTDNGYSVFNSVTNYQFDSAGKITRMTVANGGELFFSYDDYGLRRVEDNNGEAIEFTLDDRGRIAAAVVPTGELLQYTYDHDGLGQGNLKEVSRELNGFASRLLKNSKF